MNKPYNDSIIKMRPGFLSVIASFMLSVAFISSPAQPIADFNAPATACLQEIVSLSNSSTNSDTYVWDFCHRDLLAAPQVSVTGTFPATGSNKFSSIEIIQWQGEWIGFVLDIAASKLLRLNYGSNLSAFPTITDLGNLGTNLTTPATIDFIEENGVHYGFVVNAFSNNVIRITFGNGLNAPPTLTENLGTAGNTINTPFGIEVIKASGIVYVYVTNYSGNNISVINLGSSAMNAPVSNKVIGSSDGLVNPWDIELKEENGNWYGLISSLGNNKIYHCAFGSDPYGTPVITDVGTVSQGTAIEFLKEGTNNVAFIKGRYDGLFRMDFGASLINTVPVLTPLGNLGGVSSDEARSLKFIKVTPEWKGFILEYNTGKLIQMRFASDCSATISHNSAVSAVPTTLNFKSAGNYYLELTASNSQGLTSVKSSIITVTNQSSPELTITLDANRCIESPNVFNAISNLPIASYNWDFGDLSNSSSASPSHQFSSAGLYNVNLNATAANGCKNQASTSVKIYNRPLADFSLPTGVICTNNNLTFVNNTSDNFDGNLSYSWYVDNVYMVANRDLVYSFITTGTKTIKLITAIPGCSDDVTQTTSSALEGPVVDFSVIGNCINKEIQFNNTISETVISQSWNFDDGQTSTEANPAHIFNTARQYSVSLTAASPNGCNNTKTKTVPIYSLPVANFTIDAPPFSCSGAETPFTNLTVDPSDGVVNSWQWDFGDSNNNSSTLKSPKHTFANAGSYNVKLIATTAQGCSGTFQQAISIAQSPTATIVNSLACNTLPISFSATGSNIFAYYWEIGTSYYNISNPVHTFSAPGNYTAKLTVKSNNLCESTQTKNILIPVPLLPDFSVIKNCVGHQAMFTDITTGLDQVVQRNWDFIGQGTATGATAVSSYNTTGNKSVRLTVSGQSGCSYSRTKNITIIPAPVADFTMMPESGATPLNVQFTNKSIGTTQHVWSFGDASDVVTATSPAHTFVNIGDYVTELTASNNEGCESKFSKMVSVVPALPNVDLKLITLSENPDGSMQVIITVENKGNTFVKDLPVDIDISGSVSLRETIEETIAPFSLYNLVLSYSLNQINGLKFLCANALLENDLAPSGNRICAELHDKAFFFTPYPNPVKSELFIEWIAPQEQTVQITLVDAFGKKVVAAAIPSAQGLNKTTYDVSKLQSGIYFLLFGAGAMLETQRILILNQN